MLKLRGERDKTWQLLRDAWLSGDLEHREDDAAKDYEKLVVEADAMADRLRREADRVALLAERIASEKSIRTNVLKTQSELAAVADEKGYIDRRWQDLWDDSGIKHPLSPAEMIEWLDQLRELQQLIRESRSTANELAGRTAKRKQSIDLIRIRLQELDEGTLETESLEQTLDLGQVVLDRELANAQRRTELAHEIERIDGEIAHLLASEKHANVELDGWKKKWQTTMRAIGCDENLPCEQASRRIEQLDELHSLAEKLFTVDLRIRQIAQDTLTFHDDVASLCKRIAPDLCNISAEDAVIELRSRLEQAQGDQIRKSELQARLRVRRQELDESKREEKLLTAQLDQLCRLAGVTQDDLLSEIELKSARYREIDENLTIVTEQLTALSEDGSLDGLFAELGDRTRDELLADKACMEDRIADVENAFQQAVAEVRDLENERDAADGSTLAAEADQEAISILTSMQSDAIQYAKLRIASGILRQQIDKYRAENQDPLLEDASELFHRLTCGAYQGLAVEYDAADQPHIVGIREPNNERIDVSAMSDGTCDQLFLALRLAYVDHRLKRHEPMPFIVDDILIHFDDERAAATLELLLELSGRTQVIFFTHHRHLIELAQYKISSHNLFLHSLQFLDGNRVSKSPVTSDKVPAAD